MHERQRSWDGTSLTPVHDRIYGRPSACYGAPDTTTERTPSAPSPSVRESDRPAPLASLHVDTDDRDSVVRFRDEQRGTSETLASMERHIATLTRCASTIALGLCYSALLVIFFNVVTILLRTS